MASIPSGKIILVILTLLIFRGAARTEEAIDLQGRRLQGSLMHEQKSWFFRIDPVKQIPVEQLAFVRFEPANDLLPKVPLTRVAWLPEQQRLTGTLLAVDEKSIRFTSSLGIKFTFLREHVLRIDQADGWLPLLQDKDEAPLQAWKIDGKPALDPKQALFAKAALRLDESGQRLTREWQPILHDARIGFYFRCSPNALPLDYTIEALVQPFSDEKFPCVVIDKTEMRCGNVRGLFRALKTTARWHALFVERQADALRFFVDDSCLGQTSIPRDAGLKGIRLTASKAQDNLADGKEEGGFWIEGLHVSQRLAALPAPKNDQPQDWLWLVHGEQVFGRIVSADADTVVLDAKFGKHTLPWQRLRGIGFANGKPFASPGEVNVSFRPGAGFSSDCLRCRLLRWDGENLLVHHALLGEISIERGRLDKISFAVN